MVALVAFASLPFTLRPGQYGVRTARGLTRVQVAANRFDPFLAVAARPELVAQLPGDGQGEGFASYTWYSHPFVLRVLFGRSVAAMGAVNSYATISQQLDAGVSLEDEPTLLRRVDAFADAALETLNTLIARVRRSGRIYHVSDLRRDEIHITVRDEAGLVLREDPLQASMTQEEQEQDSGVDLRTRDDGWYHELEASLDRAGSDSLALELVMEAEMALARRFPRQAVTTCYTTVETAASDLLTKGMRRRGVPEPEIDDLLATRNLASKLDSLLVRYTGFSLKRDQRNLWKAFTELMALRNNVVHRGGRVSEAAARTTLQTTYELLDWLATVSSRNK
ncbi:MAG: hypothetical protein GX557_05395 [Chloroflexi bacterium]|nr:hypothetical protein [Chloroflexota bacterium]